MADINRILQDLHPNQRYITRVRAISKFGVYSDWSEALDFTTPADNSVPNPPSNLNFEFDTNTLIVDWEAPSQNTDGTNITDFKHYKVSLTSGGTTKTYTTVIPSFVYPFEQNRIDFGTASSSIDVDIQTVDVTNQESDPLSGTAQNVAPVKPLDMTGIATIMTITLYMDPDPADRDIETYLIERSTTGTGGWVQVAEARGDTYVDQVDSPGTTFYYRYRVKDYFGQISPYSEVFSIQSQAVIDIDNEPPAAVEDFTVVDNALDPSTFNPYVTVQWTPNNTDDDLAYYELRVVRTSDSALDSIVLSPYASQYRINDLDQGTEYDLVMYAFDFSNNRSAASVTQTVTTQIDNSAPNTPTNYTATGSVKSILVRWDTVDSNQLSHYEVYASTTSGFTPDATNQVFEGLANRVTIETGHNETWYFKLRAVNQNGQASAYTPEFSGTSEPEFENLDTIPPSNVTGVNAVASTYYHGSTELGKVDLSWTAATDNSGTIDQYVIRVRENAGAWSEILAGGANTDYTISALNPGSTYDFQMKAVDPSGNRSSAWSSNVQRTISTDSGDNPNQVTGLTADANARGVTFSWNEIAGEKHNDYEVQFDDHSGFTSPTTRFTTATEISRLGITGETIYCRVRARDIYGNIGNWSSTANGTISEIDTDDLANNIITADKVDFTIGGGNMISDSSFEDGISHVSPYFTVSLAHSQAESFHGSSSLEVQLDSSGGQAGGIHIVNGPVLPAGTVCVSSAWVKAPVGLDLQIQMRANHVGGGHTEGGANVTNFVGTGEWQRVVTGPWTVSSSDFTPGLQIKEPSGDVDTGQTFYVDAVQVEVGDVATAYAPKPDEILPGTINTTEIADDAITSPKIIAGAVVAGKIAADAVTANEIAADTITANEIASETITADEIASGAITANKLNIIMGGGNLLNDSSWETGDVNVSSVWSATIHNSTDFSYHGTRSLKVFGGNSNQPGFATTDANSDTVLPGNSSFAVSLWIKGDASAVGQTFQLSPTTYTGGSRTYLNFNSPYTVTISEDWQRVVAYHTDQIGDDFTPALDFRMEGSGPIVGNIYVDAVQIEEGDVATAYAPKTDEILPGTINTTHIDTIDLSADSIFTNTLNADRINVGSTTNFADGYNPVEGVISAVGTGMLGTGSTSITVEGTSLTQPVGGSGVRGHWLVILDRSNLSVVSNTTYDTHGNPSAEGAAFVTALDGITDSQIAVIVTNDSAHVTSATATALERLGLSGTEISDGRVPQAYIGSPVFPTGGGIEHITTTEGEYASVSAKFIDGGLQSSATSSYADKIEAAIRGDFTGSATGTLIDGARIQTGTVDADLLVSDIAIINGLRVQSLFQINSGGSIESNNYDGTPGSEAGFKLDHDSFELYGTTGSDVSIILGSTGLNINTATDQIWFGTADYNTSLWRVDGGGNMRVGGAGKFYTEGSTGDIWSGNGAKASAPWLITGDGSARFDDIVITGSAMAANEKIIDTPAFDVTKEGDVTASSITATGGTIGNVTIDTNKLTGGTIEGSTFKIQNAGQVVFENSGTIVWDAAATGGIELSDSGYIKTTNYDGVNGNAGVYLDENGLVVNDGTIVAKALQIGVSSENLLSNSSFENGTGVAEDWVTFGGGTWTVVTEDSLYQANSQKVVADGGEHKIYQTVTAPGGGTFSQNETIAVSYWIKQTTGSAQSVKIMVRDGGTPSTVVFDGPVTTTVLNNWTRVTAVFRPNADYASLRVDLHIVNSTAGDTLYFDGAQFQISDFVTDYAPAALEIPDNYIQSAHIQSLTADRIASGQISAAQIELANTGSIFSNYTPGSSGFSIDGDGTATFYDGAIHIVGAGGDLTFNTSGMKLVLSSNTVFNVDSTGVYIGGIDDTDSDVYFNGSKTVFQSTDAGHTFTIDTNPLLTTDPADESATPGTHQKIVSLQDGTDAYKFYLDATGKAYFEGGVVDNSYFKYGDIRGSSITIGSALSQAPANSILVENGGDIYINGGGMVIGGSTGAVDNAMKSDGYISGSDGWIVRGDGSSELNNTIVRGTLSVQESDVDNNPSKISGSTTIVFNPAGGTAANLYDGVKTIGSGYEAFGNGSQGSGTETNYIEFDFGQEVNLAEWRNYWYAQDSRVYYYKIKYSRDGTNWFYAVGESGTSGWAKSTKASSGSGEHPTIDRFNPRINARYVRLYADGNTTNNGNHIYEVEAFAYTTDDMLTVGENFRVDANGNLFANDGTFSGDITGGTISGATIIGNTFKSADSGSRIEITQSLSDRVNFYSTGGQLIGRIGTDQNWTGASNTFAIEQPVPNLYFYLKSNGLMRAYATSFDFIHYNGSGTPIDVDVFGDLSIVNGGSLYVDGTVDVSERIDARYIHLNNGDDVVRFASSSYSTYAIYMAGYSGTNFLLQQDGQVRATDGSASAPSFAFVGDGNTGLFSISNGRCGISLNGGNSYDFSHDRLQPVPDNDKYLGDSNNRWIAVYAVDGTINTSDGRDKVNISDDHLGLEFLQQLRPVTYRWSWGNRPHTGFIAQDVKTVLDNSNTDWAGLIDPAVEGQEGRMGLRYAEFIAPLVTAVQELAARLEAVEAQLVS